jgi:hypothetical protein
MVDLLPLILRCQDPGATVGRRPTLIRPGGSPSSEPAPLVAVDVESVTAVGSLMIGVVPFVVRNGSRSRRTGPLVG